MPIVCHLVNILNGSAFFRNCSRKASPQARPPEKIGHGLFSARPCPAGRIKKFYNNFN